MSTGTVDAGRVAEVAERLGFDSEDDFVETAVETFLASRPDLREELAIALYDEGELSLGRAVEVSGLTRERFKEKLDERDIVRKSGNIRDSVENLRSYKE